MDYATGGTVVTCANGSLVTAECIQKCLGKIVFDLDDVAHDPNYRIAQALGIDYEDLIDFHVLENPRLPMETRIAVNNCYADVRFFRNIKFYRGFERIMDLQQKYPVLVQTNSNSFGVDIRDCKFCAVRQAVPALPPKQMRFGIVGVQTTLQKRFDDDTLILVDDSPYNIALSPAKLNILPIQPWNQTPKAFDIMKGKPIQFVPRGDFDAIYRVIDEFFITYLSAA